jgi:hypothetical protein
MRHWMAGCDWAMAGAATAPAATPAAAFFRNDLRCILLLLVFRKRVVGKTSILASGH